MSGGGDKHNRPSILSKTTSASRFTTLKAFAGSHLGGASLLVLALIMTEVPLKLVEFFHDTSVAKWRDLLWGMLVCVVLVFIRQWFLTYLRPLAKYFVVKKKYSKDKVDRWCTVVFKAMWFAFICWCEWELFKDADYFPKEFGGPWTSTAEYRDRLIISLNTFKFQPGVKIFYVSQWGYHCMSFLWQISHKRRATFWEMMIHHIVTLLLITISYLRMYISLGIVVLVIHDWVDVVLYATKSLSDSSLKYTTAISFLFLSIEWAYVRLYAYPKCIILIILNYMYNFHKLEETVDVGFGEIVALLSVLVVLWLLHCYWFYLFLLAWMEFFKKGEVDDFHEDGIGEEAGKCTCREYPAEVNQEGGGGYQCKKVKCQKRNPNSSSLSTKSK